MKRIVMLTAVAVLAAGLAGCNTCRRLTGGWFNRGEVCDAGPPVDCLPGAPRTTMMVPPGTQVLPGPIEIAPTN